MSIKILESITQKKKRKVLIVIHDMISEIFTKHVLQNHILFSLMRAFFSQIIF